MASEAVIDDGLAAGRRERDHESDLVRRAKERSSEAWAEIYDRHRPRLYRYVTARVGDRDLAEDLTSTVFLEALKSIDSYASRGRPLLAWLYVIARNVVNHHYRTLFRARAAQGLLDLPTRVFSRFGRPRGGQDQPADDLGPARGTADPADPASAVERWDLRQAIGRLSGGQREVIVLRYFVGLTAPEVADVLGKHQRAVYSLQTRAIKALRRHLS